MNDLQAICDRMDIEALRGEFTDAAMMNDHERLASLFVPDGAVRIPDAGLEAVGRDAIRAMGRQRETTMSLFVQTTHPGTVKLAGDQASGRAYLSELIQFPDRALHLNYGIYHDRYVRTSDGWKFRERVYEIRYSDATPTIAQPSLPEAH